MKLTIDERLKHRMVGLAVLVSIVAMVIPTMMKKNAHPSFDNMERVAIHLPAKPPAPKVVEMNEAHLFQKVKVETVVVHQAPAVVPVEEKMQAISLQSEPAPALDPVQLVSALPELPAFPTLEQPVVAEVPTPTTPEVAPTHAQNTVKTQVKTHMPAAVARVKVVHQTVVAKASAHGVKHPTVGAMVGAVKPAWDESESLAPREVSHVSEVSHSGYAVQVAHFSQLQNATHLIHELRAQGFQAHYQPVHGKRGVGYTVLVGASDKKEEVMHLQQQLQQKFQLNGFVVSSSVG